jgi:hypothetical protein
LEQDHCYYPIPHDVEEQKLVELMEHGHLFNGEDQSHCAEFVPAHIGGKIKKCSQYMHSNDWYSTKKYISDAGFPHMENGFVIHPEIQQIKCPATQTIFVPIDPLIRKCIVVVTGPKTNARPEPQITQSQPLLRLHAKLLTSTRTV